MSRLDRILVSENWFETWGDGSLWALERDVSNHCPLVLKYSGERWGPKPFRFSNHWFDHKGFKDLVNQAWNDLPTGGWMSFRLKEKVKSLKVILKKWNKDTYGDVDTKLQVLVEKIKILNLRSEKTGLTQ